MQIHFRLHRLEVHSDQIRINQTHSVVLQHHLVEHLDRLRFQIKHHLPLVRPIRIPDPVDLDRVLSDLQLQRQPGIPLVHLPLGQLRYHQGSDQPIRVRIHPDLEGLLLDQKQVFLAVRSSNNNNSSQIFHNRRAMLLEVAPVRKILLLQQRLLPAIIQFLVRAIQRMLFNKQLAHQQALHLVQLHKNLTHLDHNLIR